MRFLFPAIRFSQPHAVFLSLVGFLLAAQGMEISFRKSTLFEQEKRKQNLLFDKGIPIMEFRSPESFRRAELLLDERLPLPAFRKGVLTVKLDCDRGVAIENIHARIWDATDETLDFVCTTPVRDGRMQTWRIRVNPTAPFSAWSGNRNRRIDFPAEFYNIALILRKNAFGRIRIISVTWDAEKEEKEGVAAVSVSIPSKHPLPLLDPRSGSRPELEFWNDGSQPLVIRVEAEISDFFHRRFSHNGRLQLPPGKRTVRMALPELPAQGIWKINCKLIDEKSGSVRLIERSLCHMIPAGPETLPNPAFQFGKDEDDLEHGLAHGRRCVKLLRTGNKSNIQFSQLDVHLREVQQISADAVDFKHEDMRKFMAPAALHHILIRRPVCILAGIPSVGKYLIIRNAQNVLGVGNKGLPLRRQTIPVDLVHRRDAAVQGRFSM